MELETENTVKNIRPTKYEVQRVENSSDNDRLLSVYTKTCLRLVPT